MPGVLNIDSSMSYVSFPSAASARLLFLLLTALVVVTAELPPGSSEQQRFVPGRVHARRYEVRTTPRKLPNQIVDEMRITMLIRSLS
jgi:hypothetical protein